MSSRIDFFNESFFSELDTEEKAYWLGFILTDGSVDKFGRLVIALQARDFYHLEKFKSAINSIAKLKFYEREKDGNLYPQCSIRLNSKKLIKSLEYWNVTPNKTWTARPSMRIPTKLLHHFWRGVIDGNGCIYRFEVNNNINWGLSLVGNGFMVYGFRDYLKSVGVPFYPTPYQSGERFWSILYGGVQCPQLVGKLLYENAIISLDRKLYKIQELLTQPLQRLSYCSLTKEEIRELKSQFITWKNVAGHLGLKEHQVKDLWYRLDGENTWEHQFDKLELLRLYSELKSWPKVAVAIGVKDYQLDNWRKYHQFEVTKLASPQLKYPPINLT